ncbi:V-type ATP synthase subunit E [Ruminococcaceae bacterium OttesenSCG-928-I18]|nr:V-type ATP synthase subunit E [Ruminococcaceae bacterium OttesenSCG-928-I18]
MTGLEKIVKEIKDEAANEAQATLSAAKEKADKIKAAAKEQAAQKAGQIAEEAQRNVRDVETSRESAMALQKRQHTLQTKQAVLDETLNAAKAELHSLPEGPYFALLIKLALKAAEEGEGQMLLNEKDRARVPSSFEQELNSQLTGGRKVALSGETRPIDGGFVLKYGDVEENCSFSALFDARREEFSDLVRDILFA